MRIGCLCLLLSVLAGCATSKPAKKQTTARKHVVKLEPGPAWWPATGNLGAEMTSPVRAH